MAGRRLDVLFLTALIASCGPGDNNTDNNGTSTNSATNNGVADVLELVVDITPDDGSRIMATALNADGSELAIALQDTADLSQSVVIYSTTDGRELRQMNDFAKPEGPLTDLVSVVDLYWSDSGQITALQTYRNRYSWDAASGDVLQKVTDLNLDDECAGPQDLNAFHPARNQAFVRKLGEKTNELCRINFDTGVAELAPLRRALGVIESIALDSTGDVLWVNYSNPTPDNPLSTEIVGTVSYDSQTLAPLAQRFSPNGGIRIVGDGYTVTGLNGQLLLGTCALVTFEDCGTAPGAELDANDRDFLASPNATVLSAENRTPEGVLLVALPEGTEIGVVPADDDRNRSFSADGRFGAFDIDDVVKVYDVSGRTTVSALATAPIPPAGMLSGSVTIDGDTQSITGVCEVALEDSLGPVGFLASGTTDGGWDIRAVSQNLLIYTEYVAEKDGKRYSLNTPIAQNLELPFPSAASSGTSIEGGGTLYVFTGDFLERVEDAANPTGYEAVVFTIDAVCTP